MKDSAPKKTSNELPSSMDSLHAYWRMPYILTPKKGDKGENPFTKITKTGDDAAEYILLRGRLNYICLLYTSDAADD